MRSEPELVSLLVGVYIDEIVCELLPPLIEREALSSEALGALGAEMPRSDSFGDALQAMRGGLAGCIELVERALRPGGRDLLLPENGEEIAGEWLVKVAPDGWLNQNRALLANWYLDYLILPARDGDWCRVLDGADQIRRIVDSHRQDPWAEPEEILAGIHFPTVGMTLKRVAEADTARAQAVVAIAIERFRLAQLRMPESLEELAPLYLETVPIDPLSRTGEPLSFTQKGSAFELRSVGLDADDIGDDVVWPRALEPVDS